MSEEIRTLGDGRYTLFEPIGSGGMATVYRAHDNRLAVDRAIKVLLPSYASKKKVRARFEAEARTMAVLDHPNIVRVYDVGATEDTAWIVMELVEGGTLLDRIGAVGIEVRDCLRHSSKILQALVVAHAHGVVHRDIKPHNVLLNTEGVARITDFGIARSAGQTQEDLTKTGTVMGTWAFMAPEQRVNAKGVDHTADVYGMGATLFSMCTGQTPMDLFAADLDPEMLKGVPDILVPIIRRATRYQREERYPNAKAMLADVEAALSGLDVATAPIRTPRPGPLPVPTPPTVTAAAPHSDRPSRENLTYVPDDLVPPPISTGLSFDDGRTPLPFRPSASEPPAADIIPDKADPPVHMTKPNRDRSMVAVLIILLLLVGGAIRRVLKLRDSSVEAAVSTQLVVPDPVTNTPSTVQAPPSPAPSVKPTTIPDVVPSPQPKAQPKAQPKPKPPPAAAPAPTIETPAIELPAPGPTPTASPNPALQHARVSTARMGGFLPLQATISDLRPIETQSYEITAYFRPVGTAAFQRTTLIRNRSTWTGTIRISMEMEAGLEYFLKAKSSDTTGALSTLGSGSNRTPHIVRISSP